MTWVDGECKNKPGARCDIKHAYMTNKKNCPMSNEYITITQQGLSQGYCGSIGAEDCTLGYECKKKNAFSGAEHCLAS